MRQSLLRATFPGDHFVSDQGHSDGAFLRADLGPLSWLAGRAQCAFAAAGKDGFSPATCLGGRRTTSGLRALSEPCLAVQVKLSSMARRRLHPDFKARLARALSLAEVTKTAAPVDRFLQASVKGS